MSRRPEQGRFNLARTVTFWPVGLLSMVWIICAVLINPVGDFPLNDDWAYGLPAEVLVKEHAFKLTDWQAAALVTQLGWGALFCLPMGFSFTALRLSTLTLGLVGIVGQYGLLRQLGADRRIAAFGAALLAFNPFYINLSYSFMTDIPFLALMIVSMLLLIRGLDCDRNAEILAGLLLAVLAMFIRQIGLMILIGFVVAYPLRRGFDRRWFLLALVPAVGAVGLLFLSEFVLKQLGQLPGAYHVKSESVMAVLSHIVHLRLGAVQRPLRGAVLLMMYVGQWCLPLGLLVIPAVLGKLPPLGRGLALVSIAGFTVGVSSLLAFIGWLMPMTDNLLCDFGMGIRSLAGDLPHAPVLVWVAVTALATLGSTLVLLITALLSRERWLGHVSDVVPKVWRWHVVFLCVIAILDFGPMAFSYSSLFDRYLLVFLPLTLGVLVALGLTRWTITNPWCTGTAILVLTVFLSFGVAATHDYLEWNRVRWAAAGALQNRLGLPPAEIDGGFEYNNLHDARGRLRSGWIHRPGEFGFVSRSTARARVAFQPLADHDVVAEWECAQWLPLGVSRLYLLNRRSGLDAGTTRSTK